MLPPFFCTACTHEWPRSTQSSRTLSCIVFDILGVQSLPPFAVHARTLSREAHHCARRSRRPSHYDRQPDALGGGPLQRDNKDPSTHTHTAVLDLVVLSAVVPIIINVCTISHTIMVGLNTRPNGGRHVPGPQSKIMAAKALADRVAVKYSRTGRIGGLARP